MKMKNNIKPLLHVHVAGNQTQNSHETADRHTRNRRSFPSSFEAIAPTNIPFSIGDSSFKAGPEPTYWMVFGKHLQANEGFRPRRHKGIANPLHLLNPSHQPTSSPSTITCHRRTVLHQPSSTILLFNRATL